MENYEVFEAENGKIGLELYHKHHPRIIILDLMMPVMDGIQFLEEAQIKPTDGTAVIVLTAYDDMDNIKKCYDLGVNGFLRKPCEVYELLGLVRQTMMLKQLQSELAQQHDRFGEAITECTANLRVSSCNLDRLIQALSDDYEDKLDEIGQDYFNRLRTESQRIVQLIDELEGELPWKEEDIDE